LKPLYPVAMSLGSRTDMGVHALCNSATVLLSHPEARQIYAPSHVTYQVNDYLRHKGHDINLIQTRIVPYAFCVRKSAIARSYMFRFAFLKPESPLNSLHGSISSHIPIHELNRSLAMRMPNIEKMREAARLFEGEHNFLSFMTHTTSTRKEMEFNPNKPNKIVYECFLEPAGAGHMSKVDPLAGHYEIWEFFIRANSFLYNQVRRMVGILISVGTGRLTLDDVRYMLDNPSREISKNEKYAIIVPPQGLYLVNVHYDEEDLRLKLDPENFEWDEKI